MGVYFIAAGSATQNRQKSLDKAFKRNELQEYLSAQQYEQLCNHFDEHDDVFIWGANVGSTYNQLQELKPGEYIVDVKNADVIQVFTYCFTLNTDQSSRLQNYIGWDSELPPQDRRPYPYVFFLKNPQPTKHTEKSFFQEALEETSSHWLDAQKYYADFRIEQAMQKKGFATVEEFLGIEPQGNVEVEQSPIIKTDKPEPAANRPFLNIPAWAWIAAGLLALYLLLK